MFPEQAVNWAWYARKIRAAGRPVKVLNLFGYTGGATLACAAGATVCHVDASKGIVAWGKDNAVASGLADRPIRWLVDDCAKFVAREKRRGNTYDGIIMDPPSYGRGPGGEIWKLEDCIYDLISQCEEVLSDTPLFFAVNSYTTGLSPRSWSICSRPRWCPALAARPAATRSACPFRHRRRCALRRNGHLGRMNSLSHGCRRASSLGEGAFGMAGTLTVCRKTSRLRQRPHLRGGCLRSRLGECPDGSHSEKMKKNQEWGTALLRRAHHQKEKTYGRNDFNCERSEVPL